MSVLRASLWVFTVIIFAVTFVALGDSGPNWPRTFLTDLFAGNWRSQFNADLVIHLALVGVWVAWREGFGAKGVIYGAFCVIWGGMFTFPYVLLAIHRAKGDPRLIFLGVNAQDRSTAGSNERPGQ